MDKTKTQRKKVLKGFHLLPKNRKLPYCLILDGGTFLSKLRSDLLKGLFNRRYPCRACGARKDIQIHHLYGYAPKDEIDDYEDYIKIPWIPLCRKCHMSLHGLVPPEKTSDD